MDKLNAIQVFCKVVETQSFTKTAEQLQISLAMASKLVAQLEAHLNIRLLQRTTRKISPTEVGLFYYQRCQPLLAELSDTEDCMHNLTAHLQGKLLISVPLDFGSRFIAPNLGNFIETYPHLQLQLEFSDRRVDLVAEGYDFVLRIGKLEDSSAIAKKLGEAHHILVASPQYLTQFAPPKTALELEQHYCLVYEHYPIWQFNENGRTVKFKPHGKIISNNGTALTQMAKAGLGIALVPKFLIKQELENGELIALLNHIEQPPLDIHLLYPHRRYLSAKVKVAIEFFTNLLHTYKNDL